METILRKNALVFLIFLWNAINLSAQKTYVSFPMMNQEIKHTLQENERQKDMKSNESKNLSLEVGNKTKWEKLKVTVKDIQKRLSIVDFTLQSIPTGIVMRRKFAKIRYNQRQIGREMKTLPPNLFVVFNREVKFVDDLQMTTRLIMGIVASYGSINQMERAERKILLDYAIDEVDKLRRSSSYTLFLIREAKWNLELQKAKWKYYVNRDKALVNDIIKGIKSY